MKSITIEPHVYCNSIFKVIIFWDMITMTTLKTEAASSFELSISNYQSTVLFIATIFVFLKMFSFLCFLLEYPFKLFMLCKGN